MQITRNLPRDILTALQGAGQANRFFSDMAHIDALEARGMDEAVATENTRVQGYVALVLGCTVDELQIRLQMAQAAPDPHVLIAPIAERLCAERERLGLSRAQLADIGGTTVEWQERYERGRGWAPPSFYLAQLARDAGIDALFVLTGRREGANGHA